MTTNHPDPGFWSAAGPLHGDLRAAVEQVYEPCGFRCSPPVAEPESADYGAHAFTLDGRAVRFRTGRTTPTKPGQFVTVWQRSPDGPIRPFEAGDGIDLVVVSTRDGGRFGQFVLPWEVLRERGVVAGPGTDGKRGFRVYPPWAVTANRQARGSQAWQLEHFLPIGTDGTGAGPTDLARARTLYRG
ncbi:MepB family protein [Kitasatospora sp. NPDC088346]|uniref:MepB family protein n=1 Tax=Kitasatospora sp. NPDC088346 TaxID=3364073 RepID=UPI0038187C4D